MIVSILTGGLAGWIAGKLMSSKHGFIFNIILGLIGGAVGGFILNLVGLGSDGSFLGNVLVAVVGSCLLIFVGKKL